jgi:hypothetical protein
VSGPGGAFATGKVHGGWRVTGPGLEGHSARYPVERDGQTATLTLLGASGPRGELQRAVVARHGSWRTVTHPALVRVDAGQVEGGAYVVLPSFERVGDAPLPPDAALTAVGRVAAALAVAHARDLAHGDVDAWSLVKQGDDFSLLPPGLRSPPQGLEALGLAADPRYASPEVLDGRPPQPEDDVFSLGLVLFRLVTGQAPAPGADPVDVLLARAGGAPALAQVRPDAPPALVALYRCLTAPSGLRPVGAAAALPLIEQAAAGRAPSVPARVVRAPQPVRVFGPLVLLLVLGAALWLGWTVLQTRLDPTSPFVGFKFR